jgi:putative FmdB family regulatory protein
MPTYDYQCLKCGQNFEVFQSMKDDAFKTCPEKCCQVTPWGHGDVKRQIGTGAGLIFKGSGFYTTDYRSEGYKKAAKDESTSSTPKPAEKAASSGTTTPAPAPPPASSSSGGSSSPGTGGTK